jgi:hypothetical protein
MVLATFLLELKIDKLFLLLPELPFDVFWHKFARNCNFFKKSEHVSASEREKLTAVELKNARPTPLIIAGPKGRPMPPAYAPVGNGKRS